MSQQDENRIRDKWTGDIEQLDGSRRRGITNYDIALLFEEIYELRAQLRQEKPQAAGAA